MDVSLTRDISRCVHGEIARNINTGWTYDEKQDKYFPRENTNCGPTGEQKIRPSYEFCFSNRESLMSMCQRGYLKDNPWYYDFFTTDGADAILVRGSKCLTKYEDFLPHPTRYTVTKVSHTYYVKMLLVFKEAIAFEICEFEKYLKDISMHQSHDFNFNFKTSLHRTFVYEHLNPTFSSSVFHDSVKEFLKSLWTADINVANISLAKPGLPSNQEQNINKSDKSIRESSPLENITKMDAAKHPPVVDRFMNTEIKSNQNRQDNYEPPSDEFEKQFDLFGISGNGHGLFKKDNNEEKYQVEAKEKPGSEFGSQHTYSGSNHSDDNIQFLSLRESSIKNCNEDNRKYYEQQKRSEDTKSCLPHTTSPETSKLSVTMTESPTTILIFNPPSTTTTNQKTTTNPPATTTTTIPPATTTTTNPPATKTTTNPPAIKTITNQSSITTTNPNTTTNPPTKTTTNPNTTTNPPTKTTTNPSTTTTTNLPTTSTTNQSTTTTTNQPTTTTTTNPPTTATTITTNPPTTITTNSPTTTSIPPTTTGTSDPPNAKPDSSSANTQPKNKVAKERVNQSITKLLSPVDKSEMLGIERKYYGVVNQEIEGKVILLLGASGSGKTTLVNCIANYFKGIKTADAAELFHVEVCSSDGSAPTDKITAYTFCPSDQDTPTTIIDTPGLNDSSGAEVRDHIQALKTFLANAASDNFQIHAIGFVAQAHLVRLTSSERLVMDYVSTMFGESVSDHLITFVTFADNQTTPPVVEAMKNYGITCKLHLKFNNTTLFAKKQEDIDDMDKVLWRLGYKSLKKCFKHLQDLQALSGNIMRSVQKEIYTSSIIDTAERDLLVELKCFVNSFQAKKINDIDILRERAWDLAIVVHQSKEEQGLAYMSVEDTLANALRKACSELQISRHEPFFSALSLAKSRSLWSTGVSTITGLVPIYNFIVENKLTKRNYKNIPITSFCNSCNKNHEVKRNNPSLLTQSINLLYNSNTTISFKCLDCKCAGDLHGPELSTEQSFLQDYQILDLAKKSLAQNIHQYSIPGSHTNIFEYVWWLQYAQIRDSKKLFTDLLQYCQL